jgi:vanillate O-demethylase monooxygenase subunit
MPFLRNRWYCAAWSNEISRQPLARTLLNEKVVLYRKEDGGIIAIGNVCPHRFAPLHEGKLHGDALACPYHGLQFGEGGACLLNPHGDIIPPTLRVKGYPVVERDAMAWIWMGDPDSADQSSIPAFPRHDNPEFATVGGLIAIRGNYELVSDNLLDLSHTQFLHPVLKRETDPEADIGYEFIYEGDVVTTLYKRINVKPHGMARFVWPDAPERINSYSELRWEAPAAMTLKLTFETVAGAENPRRLSTWGAEVVTPETDLTSHYFFSSARDFRQDDLEFGEALRIAIQTVFTNEDGGVIASVQENMGAETDLVSLRPVILPTDAAAVRARRILRRMLREEQSSGSAEMRADVDEDMTSGAE